MSKRSPLCCYRNLPVGDGALDIPLINAPRCISSMQRIVYHHGLPCISPHECVYIITQYACILMCISSTIGCIGLLPHCWVRTMNRRETSPRPTDKSTHRVVYHQCSALYIVTACRVYRHAFACISSMQHIAYHPSPVLEDLNQFTLLCNNSWR